jgi:hypothetical protein
MTPRRLAAFALALTALLAAACMLPDNKPRISIEFGAVPELEGAEVLVDGKVVGKLERTGQVTRINFPIEKGRHDVAIRDPRFDCQPAQVNAELDAQKIRLLATIGETMNTTGSLKPMIVFQY